VTSAVAVQVLPTLNALLNATAFTLLMAGYAAIRRRDVRRHRRLMLSACATSAAFLVSYVVYHALAGSKHYPGTGLAKGLYLLLLASHVILAAAIVPLVIVTLRRGLRGRYRAHRKIARRTLPLWAYVSVTGVIVYILLYIA
jgi:uncharacterized membrane protein YozB (DUF420 family)